MVEANSGGSQSMGDEVSFFQRRAPGVGLQPRSTALIDEAGTTRDLCTRNTSSDKQPLVGTFRPVCLMPYSELNAVRISGYEFSDWLPKPDAASNGQRQK